MSASWNGHIPDRDDPIRARTVGVWLIMCAVVWLILIGVVWWWL